MSGIILSYSDTYTGSMKYMGRKTIKDMGSNFYTIMEYDAITDIGFPIFKSEHFIVLHSGMPVTPSGKHYFSIFKEIFKKDRLIKDALIEISTWTGKFSFIIIDRLERDIYAITDSSGGESLYLGNKMICNSPDEFISRGYEEVSSKPLVNQYTKISNGNMFSTCYEMDTLRISNLFPLPKEIGDLDKKNLESLIESIVKANIITAIGKVSKRVAPRPVQILKENSEFLVKILHQMKRPFEYFDQTLNRVECTSSLCILNGDLRPIKSYLSDISVIPDYDSYSPFKGPVHSTFDRNLYILDVFNSPNLINKVISISQTRGEIVKKTLNINKSNLNTILNILG